MRRVIPPIADAIIQLYFLDYRKAELFGPLPSLQLAIPMKNTEGKWHMDWTVVDFVRGLDRSYRDLFGGSGTWNSPDSRLKLSGTVIGPQQLGRDAHNHLVMNRKFKLEKMNTFLRKPHYDAQRCFDDERSDPYRLVSSIKIQETTKGGGWSRVSQRAKQAGAIIAGSLIGILSLDPGYGLEQYKAYQSSFRKPQAGPPERLEGPEPQGLVPKEAGRKSRCACVDIRGCPHDTLFQRTAFCTHSEHHQHPGAAPGHLCKYEEHYLPFTIVINQIESDFFDAGPLGKKMRRYVLTLFGAAKFPSKYHRYVEEDHFVQLDVNDAYLQPVFERQLDPSTEACRSAPNCMYFESGKGRPR